MITDENLNDCSNKYIKSLQKKLKLVTWKFRWMSVFTILLLLASSIFHTKLKNVAEDNKILKEQLYKDETELALEYSIGYWFINQPEQINDSILYAFLKDNNAWYPEILLKQAKLESGNYTSDVYINSNNLYGMKKVGKRQTTQLNTTYKGYGCYTNWCESVLDRMLWDVNRFNNIKPTEEEYLEAMSIYAETENYVELLN